MRLAPLAVALLATLVAAPVVHASEPITLTQAMADPDWIGPPVDSGWWRWDGKAAQYLLKRNGATIRDTWQRLHVMIKPWSSLRWWGRSIARPILIPNRLLKSDSR